ncbi:hypothetical protein [Taibaiella koreensis]|uniref:hypothetical protein n=1 Tax=Taibaiella koreensis TaxID=1268548 RepID=UPI000E59B4D5|nr:hypothetical protein [Taibaiella koreensis]
MEVNPFLFYLLRDILFHEVAFFLEQVSYTTVAQYLSIVRSVGRNFERVKVLTQARIKKVDTPEKTGGFIRQIVDKRKSFNIPLSQLNQLARSVSFLGNYSGWLDFVNEYNSKSMRILSGTYRFEKYKSYDYNSLSEKGIITEIRNAVFSELIRIVDLKRIEGALEGRKYHNLLVDDRERIILRFEEKGDLNNIKLLRDEFYNASEIQGRHQVAENISYVITNYVPQIIGSFILGAIHKNTYNRLSLKKISIKDVAFFSPKRNEYFLLADLFLLEEGLVVWLLQHMPLLISAIRTHNFGHNNSEKNTINLKQIENTSKTKEYSKVVICTYTTEYDYILINYGFEYLNNDSFLSLEMKIPYLG